MIGVAVIKVTAADIGTPFLTKLLKIGIEAQSQTGRQNPPKMAASIPHPSFFGNLRSIASLDMKT
jgi:hypothetical protein